MKRAPPHLQQSTLTQCSASTARSPVFDCSTIGRSPTTSLTSFRRGMTAATASAVKPLVALVLILVKLPLSTPEPIAAPSDCERSSDDESADVTDELDDNAEDKEDEAISLALRANSCVFRIASCCCSCATICRTSRGD